MPAVEFICRIGGDGECEQILLKPEEYGRLFGGAALGRHEEMNPNGELTMDAEGYLRYTTDVPVSFSEVLELLGWKDGMRIRVQVNPGAPEPGGTGE